MLIQNISSIKLYQRSQEISETFCGTQFLKKFFSDFIKLQQNGMDYENWQKKPMRLKSEQELQDPIG